MARNFCLASLTKRTAWAIALLAGLTGATAKAASFEAALPSDCVAMVNVPTMKGLSGAFKQTQFARLLADPAMQAYVAAVKAELGQALGQVKEEVGVNPLQMLDLPTGQVTLALRLFPDKADKEPFVYFLADVSGNEEQAKEYLAKLLAYIETKEDMAHSKRGALTILAKGEPKPRKHAVFGVVGSTLAIGNDADALEVVLKNVASGDAESSLASNARLAAFRGRLDDKADMEVFVDLAKLVEILKEETAKKKSGGEDKIFSTLGIDAFQSAGMAISFTRDSMDSKTTVLLNVKGRSALLDLFHMPSKPLPVEDWVPNDVASYMSMNWNIDQFYTTLENVVNAFLPGGLALLDAQTIGPDPDNPLFNLKKDFIEPFGNRLTFVSDMTESNGQPVSRNVMAWQLEDGSRVQALLERLSNLAAMAGAGGQLKTQAIGGTTFYTYDAGTALAGAMEDKAVPLGVIAFGASKAHFFFATHVELLNRLLSSKGATLSESPLFKQVAAQFPSASGLISYTRSDAPIGMYWGMLKSGELAKSLPEADGDEEEIGKKMRAVLVKIADGSTLPEFEKVRHYFGPTGTFAVMNEQGVKAISFNLKTAE